jgi:CBS domain-containing protein
LKVSLLIRETHDKENKGKLISENVIYNEQDVAMQYFKPISYTENPITATGKRLLKASLKRW